MIFGDQRGPTIHTKISKPQNILSFSKEMWVEFWVESANCGDQKCATKSTAIKSYKWMSYIPSQNLQIAANFASFGSDEDDQMLRMDVLDS